MITIVVSMEARSQNLPVFRQWYAVQGLYNPAWVGYGAVRDFTLLHRKQWVGAGTGPVASGFFFQHVGSRRLHFGASVTTMEAVRLRDSDARFILAYGLPLSEKTTLRFGMSAGFSARKLDLSNDDFSNDPAILQAADGIFGPSGSVGISLVTGSLQIGCALPNIWPQSIHSSGLSPVAGNTQSLSQWYTIRYKFQSSNRKVEVDPWVVYHVLRDLRGNWEIGTMVTLQRALTIGFGLHQQLGPSLNTRYRISDELQAGYTWEPGYGKLNRYGSSHEFNVTYRFGGS